MAEVLDRPLTLNVLPPPNGERLPATPGAARSAPDPATELDADIQALPSADRDALRFVGAGVSQLLAMARTLNVIPVAYLLLWPVMLPWLMMLGTLMHRARARPALERLRFQHAHVAKRDLVEDTKVMLQDMDDEDRRGFLALRYVPLANTIAWTMPPLILLIASLVLEAL
jgi:hypothetical protein